jgi:hypothetical protein
MATIRTEGRAAQAAELRERARVARQEAEARRAAAVQHQARLHAIEPERMALIEEAGRVSAALQQGLAVAGQRENEARAFERQAVALERG